jgi:CRP-like cAMP-binding protein
MISQLRSFSLFQDLTQDELEAVTELCKLTRVEKGERIFQAGAEARSLFLLSAGEVDLRFDVVCYNAPVEILLERKGPGEVLGWSAVTYPYQYTLSAYAREDSELLEIKQADIEGLCGANHHFGYIFMKNTALIIAQRFQLAQQALTKEIQESLRHRDPFA